MAFLSASDDQFQLSSNTIKLLKEEAFDCETALLGLSEQNIKDLEGLKLGERAVLRVAAASLQSQAGGGPLVPVSPRPSATPEDSGRGVVDDIPQRLEGLGIGGGGSRNATQGEPPLKIVDFFVLDTAGRRKAGTRGRGDVKNKLQTKAGKSVPGYVGGGQHPHHEGHDGQACLLC